LLISPSFDALAVHVVQPYAVGDIIYASSTSAMTKLTIGTNKYALLSNGTIPAWGQLDLTAGVTGILPVANGGTGANISALVNQIPFFNATPVMTTSANLTFDGTTLLVGTTLTVTGLTTATGGIKNSAGYTGTVLEVTDTLSMNALPNNYETLICNKATAFTVTLPTGNSTVLGRRYLIKNVGVGVVTVTGNGVQLIDGDVTQSLYQWDDIIVQCYLIASTGLYAWSIM